MRKLIPLLVLVTFSVFVLAGSAWATGVTPTSQAQPAWPVSFGALVAVIISSVAIPYLTAFAASPSAPAFVTSGITTVLAGLAAVSTYLTDVQGVPDWKHALGVFVAIIIGSQAYRHGIEPTGRTERGTAKSLYDRGLQIGRRAA